MAAGLFPDTRLEVPVVAPVGQGWDLAAPLPGNTPGHSWGCSQSKGE